VSDFKVGETDPTTGRLILDPGDPLPSARVFLRKRFTVEDVVALRFYAGVFFGWRDNRYAPIDEDELRSELYRFTENAVRLKASQDGDVKFVPFQPTSAKVGNLVDAIKAETILAADVVSPVWLDEDGNSPKPAELLVCRSGSLHIPANRWIAPTPRLFSTSALSFDYEHDAPEPVQWLSFLAGLWPDDPQSIELLQDWFGYCLTGDTSQQKMLLLVGPKRSGKGTIGRILRELAGAGNVAGPTTSSLATQFGLQPLIGKTLAIVSDARFSGQPESSVVLERLLCISGEDALTIPRKYQSDVTMRLPTRFMFLTNELPRVIDTSGALASRFVVLMLRESFLGREDTELTNKLLAELPGILKWALVGWRRLRQRGRFVQPESSQDAIRELGDLASPVSAFVRDCCMIGPGYQANVDDMYAAWKDWCEGHGRDHPGTIQTFGRDLLAAVPSLRRARLRDGDDRRRAYVGIGLQAEAGPHWSATRHSVGRTGAGRDGGNGEVSADAAMAGYADRRGPAASESVVSEAEREEIEL